MTITLTTLAESCTDLQASFLAEVLERQELTEAQVIERYPNLKGWQILDRLLSQERETQLESMRNRPPSKRQRNLLKALRDQAASEGKDSLVAKCDGLLDDFDANMAKFSQAIEIMSDRVILTPKVTDAMDELAAAFSLADVNGDTEPF